MLSPTHVKTNKMLLSKANPRGSIPKHWVECLGLSQRTGNKQGQKKAIYEFGDL